jgi:transposase
MVHKPKERFMDKRLYPISREFFSEVIQPIIDESFSAAGRPAKISDYQIFCATLYVLRTGVSWRDLPTCYGYWHSVYLRFSKGSKRGLWWKILVTLQQNKRLKMNVILADSTTFKVHRHGGGLKGGSKAREEILPV